ncbi:hypothetical protein ACLB2K_075128 [Fragaria x ananassa]
MLKNKKMKMNKKGKQQKPVENPAPDLVPTSIKVKCPKCNFKFKPGDLEAHQKTACKKFRSGVMVEMTADGKRKVYVCGNCELPSTLCCQEDLNNYKEAKHKG